jgi:hypothetical protein
MSRCWCAGRLGQPVPCRLKRDRQPSIAGRSGAGTVLLRGAELGVNADDRGQVQHLAFPRVRVGGSRRGQRGVGGVSVRPQRGDDHYRARGAQQGPHRPAG